MVERTLREPPGAVTHWTGRAMAKAMGLSLRTVQRIWEAHKLQPHRVRTFKRSTDPDFAAKLDDVVGLYMNPPRHAVVVSIDEKSQIQALDRTQPGLPLKRGKCATMTHDYKRNGTTTLFAALNVLDGKVIGRCVSRHRHQEFIGFLSAVERAVRPEGDPCHRRQLRRPQTPQGAGMARRSSALDLPLHADLLLLAERRRGLLLQADPPEPEARGLPLGCRPGEVHHRYINAANRDPKPFVWTATAKAIRTKRRRSAVRHKAVLMKGTDGLPDVVTRSGTKSSQNQPTKKKEKRLPCQGWLYKHAR